jgi:hypothetical protein
LANLRRCLSVPGNDADSQTQTISLASSGPTTLTPRQWTSEPVSIRIIFDLSKGASAKIYVSPYY